MTNQESAVLAVLARWNTAGVTASQIAHVTGYPEPSVRRTIQQLMRTGHHISYAKDGIYRYTEVA